MEYQGDSSMSKGKYEKPELVDFSGIMAQGQACLSVGTTEIDTCAPVGSSFSGWWWINSCFNGFGPNGGLSACNIGTAGHPGYDPF